MAFRTKGKGKSRIVHPITPRKPKKPKSRVAEKHDFKVNWSRNGTSMIPFTITAGSKSYAIQKARYELPDVFGAEVDSVVDMGVHVSEEEQRKRRMYRWGGQPTHIGIKGNR